MEDLLYVDINQRLHLINNPIVFSLVEVILLQFMTTLLSPRDEAFYIDALINDWDPNNNALTIEFTNGVQPITTSMGSAVKILNNKFYYDPISGIGPNLFRLVLNLKIHFCFKGF